MTLTDELANDRTFLAWLRTSIALFGLGFVVAKIAYLIEPEPTGLSDRDFYTIVGVMIVLSGAAIVALGFWQHRAVVGTLGPRADTPRPRWPLAITIVAVVGSLLLSSLIIVSS
jgi:putative membrane protein